MLIKMLNTSLDRGRNTNYIKKFLTGRDDVNKGRLTAPIRVVVLVVVDRFYLFYFFFHFTTSAYHNKIFNHMNISH